MDPTPDLLEHALPKLIRETGVPVFVGGGTAIRHRAAIAAAGAVALGNSLEDGVRLIGTDSRAQEARVMSQAARLAIDWVEQGLVPDAVVRGGIRRLCEQRLREIDAGDCEGAARPPRPSCGRWMPPSWRRCRTSRTSSTTRCPPTSSGMRSART